MDYSRMDQAAFHVVQDFQECSKSEEMLTERIWNLLARHKKAMNCRFHKNQRKLILLESKHLFLQHCLIGLITKETGLLSESLTFFQLLTHLEGFICSYMRENSKN